MGRGHTQRVVQHTLELARRMGMAESDLVHVRRGALLNDIGKMGIPDSFLLKPRPLSEDEWVIMRKHAVFAYQLMAPIDIPYGHHEKWEGTGYPQGLKGEQIPLATRVFSGVDVWDGLRSDRPHREAWTSERALTYLRSESGRQFDPRVVEEFLQLIVGEQSEAQQAQPVGAPKA